MRIESKVKASQLRVCSFGWTFRVQRRIMALHEKEGTRRCGDSDAEDEPFPKLLRWEEHAYHAIVPEDWLDRPAHGDDREGAMWGGDMEGYRVVGHPASANPDVPERLINAHLCSFPV
jgi:hypothetical protein